MTETCPNCGEELTSDNAAGGLCGRCLFERGIELTNTVPLAEGSTPGTHPFAAPDPVEVEADLLSFDVLELIGQGGMGAVYKAYQRSLDRTVAIKILPRQATGGHEFAERFQREARALARLRHENIVMAYDYGLTDRYLYSVMEYVGGPNLRRHLRNQPVEPRRALEIARDVCAALQFAHENGIVHRDIKPENILLDDSGRVKIADFGLAKLLQPDPRELALTHTRHFMGTVHYMAPEQSERPHETDHRADIYSVGVVLYEMLTGELPLGRFDPPSSRADVPTALDDLVFRALEKDPTRRHQTAAGFGEAITSVLKKMDEPQPGVASDGRRTRFRSPLVAAGFFAFLLVAYFGWQFLLKYQRDKDGNTTLSVEAKGGEDGTSKPAVTGSPSKRAADAPSKSESAKTTKRQKATDASATGGLIGPVQIEYLEGLDQIVLRGDPEDVRRTIELIKQIEGHVQGKRNETPEDVIRRLRDSGAKDKPGAPKAEQLLQVFQLKYVKASEITDELRTILGSDAGRFEPDNRTNAIIAMADRETMSRVQALLKRLDQSAASSDDGEFPEGLLLHEIRSDPELIELRKKIDEATDTYRKARSVAKYPQTDLAVQRAAARITELKETEDQLIAELRQIALAKLKFGNSGQPGKPRNPDGEPSNDSDRGEGKDQVKIFHLQNSNASEAERMLRKLYPDNSAVRMTADGRTNSLIVEGDRETLAVIEAILLRLDENGASKTDDGQTTITREHVLHISVAGAQPEAPIDGRYNIDLDGYVNLGAAYGKFKVIGLTAQEAQDGILKKLRETLREPKVLVSIEEGSRPPGSDGPQPERENAGPTHILKDAHALRISVSGTVENAPIDGLYTLDLDGYVNLGAEYGKVRVAGMTADQAEKAILAELSKVLRNPKVALTIEEYSQAQPPIRISAQIRRDDLTLRVPFTIEGKLAGGRARYFLVAVGPRMGRVEVDVTPAMGQSGYGAAAGSGEGLLTSDKGLSIASGEAIEVFIEEKANGQGAKPVRVSNIIKLTWDLPTLPENAPAEKTEASGARAENVQEKLTEKTFAKVWAMPHMRQLKERLERAEAELTSIDQAGKDKDQQSRTVKLFEVAWLQREIERRENDIRKQAPDAIQTAIERSPMPRDVQRLRIQFGRNTRSGKNVKRDDQARDRLQQDLYRAKAAWISSLSDSELDRLARVAANEVINKVDSRFDDRAAAAAIGHPWQVRADEPKTSEERAALPIFIDPVKVQPLLGGMFLQYLVYNELQNAEGEFYLVISGRHLGHKAFRIDNWPGTDESGKLTPRMGVVKLPRSVRFTNGEPLEFFIERQRTGESNRLRASNIAKVTWRAPDAPENDIRRPSNLMRPFTAIHWESDRPQVEINDQWYDLLAINDVPIESIIKQAQEKQRRDYRRLIEDQMPEILNDLGVTTLDKKYTLTLRRLPDGVRETFDVELFDHPLGSKQAIVTPRTTDADDKPSKEPPP